MPASNNTLTRARVQARFAALGIPIDRAEVRALSASIHRQAVIAALRRRARAQDVRKVLQDIVNALRAAAPSVQPPVATWSSPRLMPIFDPAGMARVPRFPFGASRLREP